MQSKFSKEADDHITLADLAFDFESDVYPIGRLDADSEGLLLLSNDKSLNQKILHPDQKQPKTYWVQVEGKPKVEHLEPLHLGINIKVKGKIHKCAPAKIDILHSEPDIPERNPPIRFRKNIPTTWISIQILEGKNRQVRKMLAAVGFPVLRLVRSSILNYKLGVSECMAMQPGDVIELKKLAI